MPLIGGDDEEEMSEESDVDDFIVDDNGEPISRPMKGQKRRSKGDSYVTVGFVAANRKTKLSL